MKRFQRWYVLVIPFPGFRTACSTPGYVISGLQPEAQDPAFAAKKKGVMIINPFLSLSFCLPTSDLCPTMNDYE